MEPPCTLNQTKKMISSSSSSSLLQFLCVFLFSLSWVSSADTYEDFLQCLFTHSDNSTSISNVIYTQSNSNYSSVLQFSIQNLRFNTTDTRKPLVIVTPVEISQIQSVIKCSKKHGMQVRVRSGGHDFEGLSYVSALPFIVIDLINLRNISIKVESRTAWVQAGATIGEFYYRIAEKSKTLAFTAGICPSVGVGGHFSGGGYSLLSRKYGIAADNIIDAQLIDAQGRILDRASMGEDLFWAIRGGGGNSFGVVVAWKVNLVPVPPTVTLCTSYRTLEQNATELVHKWQYVADKLPEDMTLRCLLRRVNSSQEGSTTIRAQFSTYYLGGVDELLPLIKESFPEIGLVKQECIEMSWIESVLKIPGPEVFPDNATVDVLLERRIPAFLISFKGKSDFVQEPMPKSALEGLWKFFYEVEVERTELTFIPYAGKMKQISESNIPFPHRAGNLFTIVYAVNWFEEGVEVSQKHIEWMRRVYAYMGPYVSKNPRAAYINYRDLDLGTNKQGNTSYEEASIWGVKYFKNNFDRLVKVKTLVDPDNFFRNEQSIPPLSSE